MSNITQVVNTDKNMTSLKRSIIASEMDQTLSGACPFTLFAPSDFAVGKPDKSLLENLLKPESKAKLTVLLSYHIVPGKINFKDFKDGEKRKTVNGKELHFRVKERSVSIEGAKIQSRDVQTSNGVIHSPDTVMNKN